MASRDRKKSSKDELSWNQTTDRPTESERNWVKNQAASSTGPPAKTMISSDLLHSQTVSE